MRNLSYEIRVCISCGLRYPLGTGHSFGTRCPLCMGETRLLQRRELATEPTRIHTDTSESTRAPKTVLLDNIRSALNVGSILRSADGFGFQHAYLCGITPTPENEAVAKTSLGAEDSLPWSHHKDAVKLAKGLKKEGWRILSLEDDARAISIRDEEFRLKDAYESKTLLILGSELTGVDPDLLDLSDQIFYIPMFGSKKSFNVAVAFGIAAYAMNA